MLTENQQIGVGLIALGLGFFTFGVMFFFDTALIAIGACFVTFALWISLCFALIHALVACARVVEPHSLTALCHCLFVGFLETLQATFCFWSGCCCASACGER